MYEAVGDESVGLLHDVVEGRGQPVDEGAGHNAHGLGVLESMWSTNLEMSYLSFMSSVFLAIIK